jgi:hypothetical protein
MAPALASGEMRKKGTAVVTKLAPLRLLDVDCALTRDAEIPARSVNPNKAKRFAILLLLKF